MKNFFEIKKKNNRFKKIDLWSSRNPLFVWRAYIIISFLTLIFIGIFSYLNFKKISQDSFLDNELEGTVEVEGIDEIRLSSILEKFEKRKIIFDKFSLPGNNISDPSI